MLALHHNKSKITSKDILLISCSFVNQETGSKDFQVICLKKQCSGSVIIADVKSVLWQGHEFKSIRHNFLLVGTFYLFEMQW